MRGPIFFLLSLGLSAVSVSAAEDPLTIASTQGNVVVHPIEHATFVLQTAALRIAVDPVGGADRDEALRDVSLVLVTDIHGDHFDADTIKTLVDRGASVVVPAAVAERMPEGLRSSARVLANGEKATVAGVSIEAVPMYNLTESRNFHTKGRGNGYVLGVSGLRIYISGDTEDTPEMRNLRDIDAAFVCMNLPYTMDVEHAADAVLEMAPRIVFPYHYRGKDGLSDVGRFAELVAAGDSQIEVRQLDWYPGR